MMKKGLLFLGPACVEYVSNHCVVVGNCQARGAVVVSVVMERLFVADEESRQVGWWTKAAMPLWDRDGRNVGRGMEFMLRASLSWW